MRVGGDGDDLFFQAAAGEANALTFQFGFRTELFVLVRDAGAPLRVGLGCVPVNTRAALCVALPPKTGLSAHIFTGDRDDTVTLTGGLADIHAGSGNDVIRGGEFGDDIYGDAGDDTLYAAGADLYPGGDQLLGGDGNDVLVGSGSGDNMQGGAGNDLLFGGAGFDYMVGNAGADVVHGDSDEDTLLMRDGEADTLVDCGAGPDFAQIDTGLDSNLIGCETLLP